MYEATDLREANLFFQLVNDLYNHSSIILTYNRSPKEWTESLGDVGVATAILDCLIHRAEIVSFSEDSHRMRNKQRKFDEESVQK